MSRALLLAFAALAGCATVDIYHYEPRVLPAGSQPLAVVNWSLQDLRNVSWSYGEPDPDPSRRARVAVTNNGLVAASWVTVATGTPLDLTYSEIANGVRMVTQMSGSWTVYIYDSHERLVQLEFSSYAAARLFLDASSVLAAAPPSATVDVATIKN